MQAGSVGFVGLGRMGSIMATRILNAGHALTVYDINAASVADLVRQISHDAEVILRERLPRLLTGGRP